MKKQPKYFYHITTAEWRAKKLLHPRSNGVNRAYDEPDTARICVCDDYRKCLVAIYWHEDDVASIYRTAKPVSCYIDAKDICDSYITDEKWIIESTHFVRIGRVNQKTVKHLSRKITGNDFILGDGDKKGEAVQQRILRYLLGKSDKELIDRA